MKQRSRVLALFALSLLCAVTIACSPRSGSSDAETETVRQQRADLELGPQEADREIADRVYLRLARSRSLAGAELSVGVEQGEVTLEGVVADDTARSRAQRITARTFGVEAVVNRLAIDPDRRIDSRPSDDQLAAAVIDRLEEGPLPPDEVVNAWFAGWELRGEGWEIEVDVDDGTVLLSGTVPERDRVVQVVRVVHRVEGVRAVLSDLHWQSGLRAPGTPYPSGYYPYGYPTGHPRNAYPYDWDWYDPTNDPDPSEQGQAPGSA